MSQQEKTISELTAEYWDQKAKALDNLIDKASKETGKTREEVIEFFMKNTYIVRDARFMETPWEGETNE